MEGTFRVVWGINFWEGRITEHLLGDRYFVRLEKHMVKVVLQSFDFHYWKPLGVMEFPRLS